MSSELIERLAGLTGPDRDVDRLIQRRDPYWSGRVGVPAYTRSLDAAVALVPRLKPGWVWTISDHDEHGPNAFVYSREEKAPVGALAATPAIALLIALLRAHGGRSDG